MLNLILFIIICSLILIIYHQKEKVEKVRMKLYEFELKEQDHIKSYIVINKPKEKIERKNAVLTKELSECYTLKYKSQNHFDYYDTFIESDLLKEDVIKTMKDLYDISVKKEEIRNMSTIRKPIDLQ
jgi:hypothetical protein